MPSGAVASQHCNPKPSTLWSANSETEVSAPRTIPVGGAVGVRDPWGFWVDHPRRPEAPAAVSCAQHTPIHTLGAHHLGGTQPERTDLGEEMWTTGDRLDGPGPNWGPRPQAHNWLHTPPPPAAISTRRLRAFPVPRQTPAPAPSTSPRQAPANWRPPTPSHASARRAVAADRRGGCRGVQVSSGGPRPRPSPPALAHTCSWPWV